MPRASDVNRTPLASALERAQAAKFRVLLEAKPTWLGAGRVSLEFGIGRGTRASHPRGLPSFHIILQSLTFWWNYFWTFGSFLGLLAMLAPIQELRLPPNTRCSFVFEFKAVEKEHGGPDGFEMV